jgi:cold shock CspA family protein
VPYDPSFVRSQKHSSNLYYGASLGALVQLAKQKGYSFIGCNSKGNNAYFIRNDKVAPFKVKDLQEGYVCSTFREAMINGQWVVGKDRIKEIKNLDVYDLTEGGLKKIDPALVQY